MSALAQILLVVVLACVCSAEYTAKCAEETESSLQDGDGVNGWNLKPTAPAQFLEQDGLHKRQATSVCGYISGSTALTCGGASYCGFERGSSVVRGFGCCGGTAVGSSGVTDCSFYTSCQDSNMGCGDACSSNSAIRTCLDSTAPYCLLYSMSIDEGLTYVNYECAASPGIVVEVAESLTSPASGSASGTTTEVDTYVTVTRTVRQTYVFTSTGQTTSTSSSTSSSSTESTTPFTQSQNSALSDMPTVTVTVGGASIAAMSWTYVAAAAILQLAVGYARV